MEKQKIRDRTPSGGDSNERDSNGDAKKKKIRRKQKGGAHHPKRWKPYESSAKNNGFKNGFATAPSNTTQFLMQEHAVKTPDFDNSKSSDEFIPDGENIEDSFTEDIHMNPAFLSKEFSLEYKKFQFDRLFSMSKEDLVKECLHLESKLEKHGKSCRLSENEIRNLKLENSKLADQLRRRSGNSEEDLECNHLRRSGSDSVLDTEHGNESLLENLQNELS